MFCVLALIIFSILGIFSATHRQLAKEAFNCVFRRVTFRPCNTGFDQKIKGKIIGKLLNRSPKLAKGLNLYWESVSWLLVILFFSSLFFSGKTIYYLIKYRTCNPQEPQSCVFTSDQNKSCDCDDGKAACENLNRNVCEEECGGDNCRVCDKKNKKSDLPKARF